MRLHEFHVECYAPEVCFVVVWDPYSYEYLEVLAQDLFTDMALRV